MVAAVLFASFAVLLLIGAPIAVCLGISSVASMLVLGAGRPIDSVLGTIPQLVSAATSKTVLLAIPFFILGGNIMDKSGISAKLIRLAETCVGHFRGGVAMVCVIVACFFAAISGSGPATVAALGLILIPALIKTGYKPAFSAALMAAAGAIGVIIPPSITFVVYGSISDTSIGDLFISGVVPGLLMGLTLIVVTLILGRKSNLIKMPKATWKERWTAFKDAFWGLLMPVIILGGIYGGYFTPTEAAAVSAVYGLFVGVVIYRTIKWKNFVKILIDTAVTTSTVMFITAAATLFAYVLTRARLDVAISNLLIDIAGGNTIIFLLIVPAYRKRCSAHCRLLPRFDFGAVYIHAAVHPCRSAARNRPCTFRNYYDSQPCYRPVHASCRRKPLCCLRHRRSGPEGNIEGCHSSDNCIACSPAACNVYTPAVPVYAWRLI